MTQVATWWVTNRTKPQFPETPGLSVPRSASARSIGRIFVVCVSLIAGLTTVPTRAVADPAQVAKSDPDRDAAVRASPWIDLNPIDLLAHRVDAPRTDAHPVAAALTVGGIYAAFTTWTYFAWYRKHKPLSEFKWGGDGYFSSTEYAGGSDKLGHAWATMGLGRAGAEILRQWGGHDRWTSALVGAGLADLLFLGVEVKDGFYYEFSYGDFLFDSIGAGLAIAMTVWPRFDELFDYRVEYWPSREYRAQLDHGNVNIAEDYSGEIYMAALHVGAIDHRMPTWTKFVDVAIGFGTKGYKPEPPAGAAPYDERQTLYFGVSLNAQGVFDYLFSRRAPVAGKITHGLFEMFNAPFSFVGASTTRRPDGTPDHDGA